MSHKRLRQRSRFRRRHEQCACTRVQRLFGGQLSPEPPTCQAPYVQKNGRRMIVRHRLVDSEGRPFEPFVVP